MKYLADISERKVLLISQVFYPDEVAVANLFTILCSELIRSGINIEVWCAQPSYTTTQRQPGYRVYQGIRIYYLSSTNFSKNKLYGRAFNFITFTLSVVARLIFSKDKTQIVSHTTPPFLAIIISFISRLKNRIFIYVLMDVFPDGLIRLERASANNIFIRCWQHLHLGAFKRSKKIIVIGRDMHDWLISVYPQGSSKIEYIPLWQDDDLIKPTDFNSNPFVITNNLQNHFIVQYSGNMGLWNEMKIFADAVNDNLEDILFTFIGGGMRKNELVDSILISNPSNAIFFPFQTNSEYSNSVTACHIALVSLREEAEGMAVPSKIIGIMAAGIPVIAMVPENSEIAYIVKEANCGYVLNPSDKKGLIDAILELKTNEVLRQEMGQNGRNAFNKKYTTSIIAKKYDLILSN
jgi:glycosyltransferase involved in cell wall biosynthesis